MNYPRLSVLMGVVTLAIGVVTLIAPDVVPVRPGRVVLTVLGVLTLVQALRVIQRRRYGELDEAETPDPERVISTPRPGDNIESVVAPFLDRRRVYGPVRRIREGLTAVAVTVLTRYEGVTESEAIEQVEAGTWTDDTYAAIFLREGHAGNVPLRTRIRNKLAGESPTQFKIRRTAAAIVAVAERRLGPSEDATNSPPDPEADDHTTSDTGSERRVSAADSCSFGEGNGEIVHRGSHPTGHWRGVSVVALVGIGVGLVAERPSVLLGGVVGIGYVAYAHSSALPPGQVAIDRTLSAETPAPGAEVTVTVTITNASSRVLSDVRIVDGVPEALAVTSGSPRYGTALRPEKSKTFSYAVTARRGVHTFGPTHVIGRNLTGSIEEERLYESEETITCIPPLPTGTEPIPLRKKATRFVGRERSPTTGEGIEFSATREYRPGDPMARIDWNRHARTRELTTIEFREERAATVVVLIDARASAYVSPNPRAVHAVDRCVDAAGQLLTQLWDAGNRVGLAVAGADSCWLAPDNGVEHRETARELLAVDPALSPVPKSEQAVTLGWQTTLRKRLEPGTQILFLSPLSDEASARIALQFDERGFPVTVFSPDPTHDRSPSHQLAGVARQLRVSTLRGANVPVVDWPWEAPFDVALVRYNERRRR